MVHKTKALLPNIFIQVPSSKSCMKTSVNFQVLHLLATSYQDNKRCNREERKNQQKAGGVVNKPLNAIRLGPEQPHGGGWSSESSAPTGI
jgi:hypothetical protein